MRTKFLKKLYAGVLLLLLGLSPTVSAALTSQGNGRATSQDIHSIRAVKVCDINADGRAVYTRYQRMGSTALLRLDETRGNGNCESTAQSSSLIVRHRSCANVGLGRPDNCNSYVHPTP